MAYQLALAAVTMGPQHLTTNCHLTTAACSMPSTAVNPNIEAASSTLQCSAQNSARRRVGINACRGARGGGGVYNVLLYVAGGRLQHWRDGYTRHREATRGQRRQRMMTNPPQSRSPTYTNPRGRPAPGATATTTYISKVRRASAVITHTPRHQHTNIRTHINTAQKTVSREMQQ